MFLVHGELTLATSDPQAIASFSEIEEKLNCKIRPVLVRKSDIIKTLNESGSDNIYDAEILEDLDDDFEFIDNAPPDDYAGGREALLAKPKKLKALIAPELKKKSADALGRGQDYPADLQGKRFRCR
jgi:hypothetical protein